VAGRTVLDKESSMRAGTPVIGAKPQPVRTLIPARVDRMRWSRFHTRWVLWLSATRFVAAVGS
jgi:hypothetical protein